MVRVLMVGLGGFLGAILRFGVTGLAQRVAPVSGLPVGTLAVNVVGCLALGWIAGLAEIRGLSPDARAFLVVGILGGFTTFSAFGHETFEMLRDGASGLALAYVALQVIAGIAGVWLGLGLARLP